MKWLLALALIVLPALGHSSCQTPGQSQLAIIIDDIGYHLERGIAFAELPQPVTLSIIPATPHGQTIAAAAQAQGKEVMVHMPMTSHQTPNVAPLALTDQLAIEDFKEVLDRALAHVPGASGMNNHMGSALTENRVAMDEVMAFLADRRLFFIDSRTTPATVAAAAARARRIPHASRAVFLDNVRDSSQLAIKLAEAVEIAQARGHAIAIGHAYPETLQFLSQALVRLPADILLTPASSIAGCSSAQSLTSIP